MIISPTDQLGAVTRKLQTAERDGRPVTRLIATRSYRAQPDDVWEALTDPGRIPRWFLPVSGDLRVGGRYQFEGNAGGSVLGCDAPRAFEITWEMGDQVSWLAVALEPDDERTTLTLTHDAVVNPQLWERFGPGAVGVGWEGALMGLALHLASGEVMDPAEFQAWSISPEGVAFNSGASEAWGEANIEFGTDPEIARAAAENCTAFYTTPPAEG